MDDSSCCILCIYGSNETDVQLSDTLFSNISSSYRVAYGDSPSDSVVHGVVVANSLRALNVTNVAFAHLRTSFFMAFDNLINVDPHYGGSGGALSVQNVSVTNIVNFVADGVQSTNFAHNVIVSENLYKKLGGTVLMASNCDSVIIDNCTIQVICF